MLDPTDVPETSSGNAPWGTRKGEDALHPDDPGRDPGSISGPIHVPHRSRFALSFAHTQFRAGPQLSLGSSQKEIVGGSGQCPILSFVIPEWTRSGHIRDPGNHR